MEQGKIPELAIAPRLSAAGAFFPSADWRLEAGLSATPTMTGDTVANGHRVQVRLTAARVQSCLGLFVASSVSVGPCGFFEMGRLRGWSSVELNRSGTLTWLEPGLLMRAVWFQHAGGLYGDAGMGWPLVRGTFYFNQTESSAGPTNVYSVPKASFAVSAGLALQVI